MSQRGVLPVHTSAAGETSRIGRATRPSAARRWWGRLWRLGVCGVLLVWIFHSIFVYEGRLAYEQRGGTWHLLSRAQQWQAAWTDGPAGLWTTLTAVRPLAFGVSLGFMGLTLILGVLRWRLVLRLQGFRLSLAQTFEISLIAHFFNSFLLGSTGGDLLKAYYAAQQTQHKKTEAVTTVIVDRLLGLFSMLLFAGLMFVPNQQLLAIHPRLAALGAVTLAMLIASAAVVFLSFWGGMSRGWPTARLWLRRLPLGETLERGLDACRACGKDRRFFWRALTFSMVLNVCCVAQFAAVAHGLGLEVPWRVLCLCVPTIICISALPITPSGLGVRENLYVLVLTVPEIGVSATQALSLSLLAYAGSLLWSLLGGALYARGRRAHAVAGVRHAEPAEVS